MTQHELQYLADLKLKHSPLFLHFLSNLREIETISKMERANKRKNLKSVKK